jgi:hypothetical protein
MSDTPSKTPICDSEMEHVDNLSLYLSTGKHPVEEYAVPLSVAQQLEQENATLRAELDEIKEALPDDSPCRHPEITGVSLLDDIKDLVANKAPWVSDYDRAKLIHDQSAEIAALRELAEGLHEALELLYDHQNGCPLPKYEKDWTRAMKDARAAMDLYRAACPGEGQVNL